MALRVLGVVGPCLACAALLLLPSCSDGKVRSPTDSGTPAASSASSSRDTRARDGGSGSSSGPSSRSSGTSSGSGNADAGSAPPTCPASDAGLTSDGAQPAYNGVWGVEYSVYVVYVSSSTAPDVGNSGEACSGAGAAAQGLECQASQTSLQSLVIPSFSFAAPAGGAAASASASGNVEVGLITFSGAISTTFSPLPSAVELYAASSATISWSDTLVPPAAGADGNPAGTPITYDVSLAMTKGEEDDGIDCTTQSHPNYTAQLAGGPVGGTFLEVNKGCQGGDPAGPDGGDNFTVDPANGTLVTSYGAAPIPITVIFEATLLTDGDVTYSAALRNVQTTLSISGAPYTTGSGQCYGEGCTCK